ncbi:helix-turn-helix domain-containing protein [Streptomyces antibioticus]|uniref:helix-turn-helix domain-containing protein n=1 Tax=Streptomyces antibioticus TaxID=1890 RepID=UPI0036BA1978
MILADVPPRTDPRTCRRATPTACRCPSPSPRPRRPSPPRSPSPRRPPHATWAAALCTGSTSLLRAFRAETGTAFSEWRTRPRRNHSPALLDQGQLVGAVAARVGLVSADRCIPAFRRHFGRTAGAYVREGHERSA